MRALRLAMTICAGLLAWDDSAARALDLRPPVEPARGDQGGPLSQPAPAPQEDGLDLTEEEEQEALDFVLGNTAFVAFHELGHALISVFEVPVLGREEDAVDSLAAIVMIPDEPDEQLDQMIIDAAWGWLLSHERAEREGMELAFWGEHGLDKQRFFQLVCLLYGSDPEGFQEFADAVELPSYRQESCAYELDVALTNWGAVLGPHMRNDRSRDGGLVHVRIEEPPEEYEIYAAMLTEHRILDRVAEFAMEEFRLPRDITIVATTCGEANAWWDPGAEEITICYDMMEDYLTLIIEDIMARR